ncbi:uncharacterized protein [Battus philenor]|uniref:uncharacterized protein n=1 Tax=Battus philenor TaxID=42288 RepID=UPI0035D132C1
MNIDKISCDEVPQKFTEWLLAMGCSAEKIPDAEKMNSMCRGQFYMVWRSLMEHVFPKKIIKEKRLKVFCNDLSLCTKKNAFSQNTDVVVPEQLLLWKKKKNLKEKVFNAERRLEELQESFKQLNVKIETRVSHRKVAHQNLKDIQRRVWFLQQVAEKLKLKKESLGETKEIAYSLCQVRDENEIKKKVENFFAALQSNQTSNESSVSTPNFPFAKPLAVSTINEIIDNEDLSSLVKCGDVVWTQFCERRDGLAGKLEKANTDHTQFPKCMNLRSVVAHTASIHCTLALEAMKNRLNGKRMKTNFVNAINDFNISEADAEFFVVRCEKVRSEARLKALRVLLQELKTGSGIFTHNRSGLPDESTTISQISVLNKTIETKSDELKSLLLHLGVTEGKIDNVNDCLLNLFHHLQKDLPINQDCMNQEIIMDLPKESISTIRQFYEDVCKKTTNKLDLSIDCDTSDYSYSDVHDDNPRFIEELQFYMKKFNLNKNRKLVFDSGKIMWITETIQALKDDLHSVWLSEEMSCSLIRPSIGLHSLRHLLNEVETKSILKDLIIKYNNTMSKNNVSVDINQIAEEERQSVDKIKKRVNSNLLSLQQSSKTLEQALVNLNFWAGNDIKKYISIHRTVNGKTYRDYETCYLESSLSRYSPDGGGKQPHDFPGLDRRQQVGAGSDDSRQDVIVLVRGTNRFNLNDRSRGKERANLVNVKILKLSAFNALPPVKL